MNSLEKLYESFWNPDVWLPPNITWDDMAPGVDPNIQHPNSKHLIYPLPMALLMFLLRCISEKYLFAPFGMYLGLTKNKPKEAPKNEILEKAFRKSRYPNHKQVQGLAKQVDWSTMQVQRWLRLRRAQTRPTTLVKFCENSWRCMYYTFSFTFGCYILWDKEWLWDIQSCWRNFPHQSVTSDVWWYYMINLAYYWSLSFSQFFDVKRKDFWQMFVHHLATIALMSFSWVCNMTRIGSLVIILHDCSDIFLEAAKMAKYTGKQKVCDGLFVILLPLWIITRVGVYPFWIIKNTMFDAPKLVPIFTAYYILNALLVILMALHVFWTYLMLAILISTLRTGHIERDVRSSSDEDKQSSE